jgi:hypothetical protein
MYRGSFKFKNANGTPQTYKRGDIVTSQGRLFLCKKLTTQSPLQDKRSWQTTGLSEPFQGANPPINPIENQLWINGSGKMYVWYKDTNGFQWIEV